jgi:diguanylate cyclase (GGDEF)-like protein
MAGRAGLRDTVDMWKAALLLLLSSTPVGAQEALRPLHGQPLQQRFGVEQHDASPANHDVLALSDGSVLVANGAGILHFDGSRWDLFELPGVSPARALALGRDDRVYVGGYDQFGRLDVDATGAFRYVDLRAEFGVEAEQATFGIVWDVLSTSRGLYFRTDETLYFLGFAGERERWQLGQDFRRVFAVGEHFYTRRHGVGFGRLDGNGFQLVPGGAAFADLPLSVVFERKDGLLLVSSEGCFLASTTGIRRLPAGAAKVLAERDPGPGLALADGGYLLGTDSGEVLHLDAGLDLLAVHALGPYSVLQLEQDREGGVWAATEGDLVRMRLPSPWSAFSAREGLAGSPLDTAFHAGALWVGTSTGVYRSTRSQGEISFQPAIDTSLEANSLLAVEGGLLVGDREGVLWRSDHSERVERVAEVGSVFDLQLSTQPPTRVFALGQDEIAVLMHQGDRWQAVARWPLLGMSVSVLFEDGPDRLWLDDFRGAPQRWSLEPDGITLRRREVFGKDAGIDWDPALGTLLHQLDGRLYAVSGIRTYRLDGERFEPFTGAPFSLFERPFNIGIAETAHGDFVFSERQLFRRLPGTEDWQLAPLGSGLARGFFGMQTDADGKLRVKTWGGLLQFDPDIPEPPLVPLAVALAGWELRNTDGETRALRLEDAGDLMLGRGDTLAFDFRMSTMEPGVEYRYRVDGLDGGWSEWAAPQQPSLSLRAPGPGRYRLRVEGRTRNGRVGSPLDFTFAQSAAWWQGGWARFGFGAALLLLLWLGAQGIARLRYRQYLAANRRLEERIAERTAELEQANQKLAELATEDSLTGIANRRALEQALGREWERCGELSQPLSLVMIDVDHFKQFNDRHGHLEGDRQLVRVAEELALQVRPVRELLARFGGEEFAVVLPGIGLDEALLRAEAMREAFDNERFATTISIGVACEVPDAVRTPTHLLRDADTALYAAKRRGRNRVVSSDS